MSKAMNIRKKWTAKALKVDIEDVKSIKEFLKDRYIKTERDEEVLMIYVKSEEQGEVVQVLRNDDILILGADGFFIVSDYTFNRLYEEIK